MNRKSLSTILSVGILGIALSIPSAQAGTILVFGQNGLADTVTATNNSNTGINGGTVLSAVDVQVTVSAINAPLTTPFAAFLNLSATSDSNAVMDATGHITQDFNGSFTLTSGTGGSGTDYLSGTFAGGGSTGASGATVFGAGTSLTFSASSPNGVTSFLSDVIATRGLPQAISLAFTDVNPAASITVNNTLAAFASNISGNFSAGAVPEPASVALLGIGLAGLLASRRFFKRTSVVR